MSLATVGAFAVGEFPEAAMVMILYQIGELFQDYAVNKSRKSIASLMDIRPDYANVYRDDKIEKVNSSSYDNVQENIKITSKYFPETIENEKINNERQKRKGSYIIKIL